jgi:L-asparaginase
MAMISSKKPKICLLYTGGTIGMVRDADNRLQPPADPNDFLRLAPELSEIVTYDFVILMNKDSTNVVPRDWMTIADAIYDRRDDGYDGFVVVHGTDTMHFSASAVAFALGPGLPFPVVFTGAQTIPEVKHGDARVNLLRACAVATHDIAEVVIVFGDYIFRGARAQKKDERKFDAFECPATFPLGFITEDIVLSPEVIGRRDRAEPFVLRNHFAPGILQVSLIPGLEPSLVRPALKQKRCRGLILQSFGAGNVPHEGPYSFLELIEAAVEHGKPVIVTSQFPANSTLHTSYAPGREAVKAGAIPTGNMTASCSVAKFRWALALLDRENQASTASQRLERLRTMMSEPYIGELDQAAGNRV